jgi:hypothetical protein
VHAHLLARSRMTPCPMWLFGYVEGGAVTVCVTVSVVVSMTVETTVVPGPVMV